MIIIRTLETHKCIFYSRNSGLPKKILKGKVKKDDKVPQVNTFRDLHTHVFSVIRYLGPYTAYDPLLIAKIIRLGKTFMIKVKCMVHKWSFFIKLQNILQLYYGMDVS